MTYFTPDYKHDLNDVGTRYKHYSDLLSLWNSGEEILELICSRPYVTETDQINLERLRIAITLLETQINELADYSTKKWKMQDQIDDLHRGEGV